VNTRGDCRSDYRGDRRAAIEQTIVQATHLRDRRRHGNYINQK